MQHLSVRVSSLIEEVVVRRFTEDERVEVWDRWQAGVFAGAVTPLLAVKAADYYTEKRIGSTTDG